MRTPSIVIALLAFLVPLPGCLERTEKITLNPDGSGKCQIDVTFLVRPSVMLVQTQGDQGGGVMVQAPAAVTATGVGGISSPVVVVQVPLGEPMDPTLPLIVHLIHSAQGVEAWSDVSFTQEKSGRCHFTGTAYFKDITAFHFSQGPTPRVAWSKNPDGTMTLALTPSAEDAARPAPVLPDAKADARVAEERVKQGVAQSRDLWQKNKAAVTASLATFKINETFILPGKVEGANIFQAVPGGVELVADGKKMADAQDKLINDDAAIKEAVAAGRLTGLKPDNDLTSQWLFGKKGRITASVGGELKPQFDYKTEVQAARRAEPRMFAKLGLPAQNTTGTPVLDGPVVPVPVH